MTNPIVTVNVAVNSAPANANLQKKGAMLTQGGTTTAVDASTLLTAPADLAAIKQVPRSIASAAWAGDVVTITTIVPHGYTNGRVIPMTVAGFVPTEYNGNYDATITGASTFTYPLVGDPGADTTQGTFVPQSAAELQTMVDSFFNMGLQQSVYVLELGAGSAANGVTALDAYLDDNPQDFYSFLVPRLWDAESTFRTTILAAFEQPNSKTYFFIPSTTGTEDNYTGAMKCAMVWVDSPDADPAISFDAAQMWWVTLNYAPTSTNKVTPLCFAFLFGATPWLLRGNQATLATFKADAVNFAIVGSEGGSSNIILEWGTAKDGKPFGYWYSVDYVQINMDLQLSATIINGSNNPANPLYYDQDGINRLQATATQVMSTAVSNGLALGQVRQTQMTQAEFMAGYNAGKFAGQAVVNAVQFIAYAQANPGDYPQGKYNGLTIVYTPQRGFTQMVVNLVVTDFVTP